MGDGAVVVVCAGLDVVVETVGAAAVAHDIARSEIARQLAGIHKNFLFKCYPPFLFIAAFA